MKIRSRLSLACALAGLASTTALASLPSASAEPTTGGAVVAAPQAAAEVKSPVMVPLMAAGYQGAKVVSGSRPKASRSSGEVQVNTKISVTYNGFTAEAKAAFQRAVDTWQAWLPPTTTTVNIQANWTALGTGVLGSAGSYSRANTPGALQRNTWYSEPVANLRAGYQISSEADIFANFSSVFPNWHFGTDAAPANAYDFETVVLHEIGHGLGFAGQGRVYSQNGSTLGSVTNGGIPGIYDRYAEDGAGTRLTTFTQGTSAMASRLTTGDVYFDTQRVRDNNGGNPAYLYTPNSWQQGSSYSHLDESTFARGTVNALMTPSLSTGETIRAPGGLTMAFFGALGW